MRLLIAHLFLLSLLYVQHGWKRMRVMEKSLSLSLVCLIPRHRRECVFSHLFLLQSLVKDRSGNDIPSSDSIVLDQTRLSVRIRIHVRLHFLS